MCDKTKKCSGCKEIKIISSFGNNIVEKDGLNRYCKECRKKQIKKYNDSHRDDLRKRSIDYYKKNIEKCLDSRKRWSKTISGKESARKQQRNYWKNNREKAASQMMLRYMVFKGKIIKPTNCAKCGITGVRICGHHIAGYDLENRYNVVWLCDNCHKIEHNWIKHKKQVV
jgi:hypothetical protein